MLIIVCLAVAAALVGGGVALDRLVLNKPEQDPGYVEEL